MSAGIGFTDTVTSKQYAIRVSDNVDYEVSFWFKQPTRQPTFEVSAKAFSCDLFQEMPLLDIQSGAFENVMLPANAQICSLEDKWNFFHGIIYNKNQPVEGSLQPQTSHAAGTNLIMTEGVEKIFVNVICAKNCMLIWDFKVKPARTPFSTGFIQSQGLIEIWRQNNRKDMAAEQLDALASNFLLPYETSTSVINI